MKRPDQMLSPYPEYGTLLSTGLIAGEGLAGVGLALLALCA